MNSPTQDEFDFGEPRQKRIARALRSTQAVSRAVPLSDTDKLTLACMDSLAQQIAIEVQGMTWDQSKRHTAARIASFVASLEDVSPEFARETSRFLVQATRQFLRGQA